MSMHCPKTHWLKCKTCLKDMDAQLSLILIQLIKLVTRFPLILMGVWHPNPIGSFKNII